MENLEQKTRLEVLAKIIEQQKPSNQLQIIQILEKDHGIEATQAMVSRDLKKLGVVLQQEDGKRVYALPGKDTQIQMLRLVVTNIQYNENTIVISTTGGTAPFVGDKIDEAKLDILGCIAGENTIFVIPKSIKFIKRVYKELCEALHYTNGSEYL